MSFQLGRDRPTNRRTDGPTDGRTDTPSFRDARMHQKTQNVTQTFKQYLEQSIKWVNNAFTLSPLNSSLSETRQNSIVPKLDPNSVTKAPFVFWFALSRSGGDSAQRASASPDSRGHRRLPSRRPELPRHLHHLDEHVEASVERILRFTIVIVIIRVEDVVDVEPRFPPLFSFLGEALERRRRESRECRGIGRQVDDAAAFPDAAFVAAQ